ncbi:hypothetical protein [Paenibacillus odorifer]|uniref:hypothetical protein n=1 Tax=Paenibacillus odorifer TaxID=189426 RepID=UPI0020BF1AD2|nr:hypothetical protein [Paenibacillus odorifer]
MRKSMQVYSSVKSLVESFKKDNNLSNESEVIAYLYEFYRIRQNSVTVVEDREIKQRIKALINQATL